MLMLLKLLLREKFRLIRHLLSVSIYLHGHKHIINHHSCGNCWSFVYAYYRKRFSLAYSRRGSNEWTKQLALLFLFPSKPIFQRIQYLLKITRNSALISDKN